MPALPRGIVGEVLDEKGYTPTRSFSFDNTSSELFLCVQSPVVMRRTIAECPTLAGCELRRASSKTSDLILSPRRQRM